MSNPEKSGFKRPENVTCSVWEPRVLGKRTCRFFIGPACCAKSSRFECEEAVKAGKGLLQLAKRANPPSREESGPSSLAPFAPRGVQVSALEDLAGDLLTPRGGSEAPLAEPECQPNPPRAATGLLVDLGELGEALIALGAVEASQDMLPALPRGPGIPWRAEDPSLDLTRRLQLSLVHLEPGEQGRLRRLLELLEDVEAGEVSTPYPVPLPAPRRKPAKEAGATAQVGFDSLDDGGDEYVLVEDKLETGKKTSKPKKPGPYLERPPGQLEAFKALCTAYESKAVDIREFQVRQYGRRILSSYRPQDAYRWIVFYGFCFFDAYRRRWDIYDASSYNVILHVIPEDLLSFRW